MRRAASKWCLQEVEIVLGKRLNLWRDLVNSNVKMHSNSYWNAERTFPALLFERL